MKITTFITVFAAGLISIAAPAPAEEINDGPSVTHIPTVTGYRGQLIPVYAKVAPVDTNLGVSAVSLHVAEAPNTPSTKLPMRATRDDHFGGTIPPTLYGSSKEIWYFIAAYDTSTNLTQTRWFPVTIKDPDLREPREEAVTEAGSTGPEGRPIPAGETTAVSYGGMTKTEIGIIAGGALAGGIVLGSGGGGGGSSFDDSNTVNVPGAGVSSGGFSSAPQDTIIDGSADIAGRPVQAVRVTLNYEAFTVPDRFQIIYEGSAIGDTGNVSGSGTIQATANGSSPIVIIRVITDQGGTLWDWTATVEYSVADT